VTSAASSGSLIPPGPLGAERQDEVAEVGGRVVHAHLDLVREVGAELGEHRAGLAHDPRPVRARLVPVGRQPEQAAGVARAERADDHVVHGRRVLDDVDPDPADVEAELRAGGVRVGEQPLPERGVDPRAGDDAGAVRRRARVHRLDGGTDVLGGEDALLDQELADGGLEQTVVRRLVTPVGTRRRVGVAVIVVLAVAVVIVIVVVRHRSAAPGSSQLS